MSPVHGHCDAAFQPLCDLFDRLLIDGSELGASICVNIDGRNVVDLWGGYANAERTKAWERDTITTIWSTTKVITALAANMLIDRGILDPTEKISTYWPEFAANGKENILVSHVLSHSSGLPSWESPNTVEDIYNAERATEKIATQRPWWTPGEQLGYHIVTQGCLVGELVRRTTGQSLAEFIADQITGPLHADCRLGVPEPEWSRTADIIPPPPPPEATPALDPESIASKALAGVPIPPEAAMTAAFRNAELGASNAFTNARALARIASVVALGGTVDGKQYLSPAAIDQMLQERSSGLDQVLLVKLRWGLGVGLPVPETVPWLRSNGRLCFWCGWGGSVVIMDLDRRMSIAYVMNNMGCGVLGSERTAAYVETIYRIVDAHSDI
ncbi:serine hydrolase domain-containing protein [Aspergillus mulundensis]|uniref:Beta-lactamase-related domain-containing protein n=1 Tax=Aspergillus mulundensis TaxID=1810919 RepID=A0A3D8RKH1_9EURO|nr:hypothetical protein DSM5745_07108 [Aspergillus mulundensis]RDW74446.1 hypothetical protein DSM5745_07108 [Aspergillus mulundensis]